jgi:hypothetical protein
MHEPWEMRMRKEDPKAWALLARTLRRRGTSAGVASRLLGPDERTIRADFGAVRIGRNFYVRTDKVVAALKVLYGDVDG